MVDPTGHRPIVGDGNPNNERWTKKNGNWRYMGNVTSKPTMQNVAHNAGGHEPIDDYFKPPKKNPVKEIIKNTQEQETMDTVNYILENAMSDVDPHVTDLKDYLKWHLEDPELDELYAAEIPVRAWAVDDDGVLPWSIAQYDPERTFLVAYRNNNLDNYFSCTLWMETNGKTFADVLGSPFPLMFADYETNNFTGAGESVWDYLDPGDVADTILQNLKGKNKFNNPADLPYK
jgi:hypothetical protein